MKTEFFKQTWWDENLNSNMEIFKDWIGDYTAESKVALRKYVAAQNYNSLADFGCGIATEFFGYKNDGYFVDYTGIDSSRILFEMNTEKGVPMLQCDVTNTPLEDSSIEVSFSRHVWEHQPTYGPVLEEMIRVASKEVIHIFFIKPGVSEEIKYDQTSNLYHNRYSKIDIENTCLQNPKVDTVEWVELNDAECVIHIKLK